MFTYQGFTLEHINSICDTRQSLRKPAKVIYWTSEGYSFGLCFREYSDYPSWLPLYVYSQHGACNDPVIGRHEIENDAEAMIVFNRDSLEEYKKVSKKPCYLVTMPFVTYRRQHKVVQREDARGTLVFPTHSSYHVEAVYDINVYTTLLKRLPEAMQPVCVCLHQHDILKGIHKEFIKYGFPVYTAGDTMDPRFVSRFYDLIRHFRFTASDGPGSPSYYSIEMGIPFSTIGERATFINHSDDYNGPLGVIDYTKSEYKRRECEIFSGLNRSITLEQKEFVRQALGIGEGLSGSELKTVLMQAYWKRGRIHSDLFRWTRRRLKKMFIGDKAKGQY